MKTVYTERAIQDMADVAERQRATIAGYEGFLVRLDGDFWGFFAAKLESRIEELRSERAVNFKRWTEAEVKANIAAEVEIVQILQLPQRTKAELEAARQAHTKFLSDIANARKHTR